VRSPEGSRPILRGVVDEISRDVENCCCRTWRRPRPLLIMNWVARKTGRAHLSLEKRSADSAWRPVGGAYCSPCQ